MKKFILSVTLVACGSLAFASEAVTPAVTTEAAKPAATSEVSKTEVKKVEGKSYFTKASDACSSAKTAVCDFSHNWVGQYIEAHPYYAILATAVTTVLVVKAIEAAQVDNEDEL